MSEYVMDYSGWAEGIPAVEYLKVCDAMHARKREEIVRCRDCYWCHDSIAWAGALECDYINRGVEPDGYCAWGERRDA